MTLLKVAEAAQYLNCHPHTLRKLIREGKLSVTRLGPRSIRIDQRDLEALRAPRGGDA